MNESELEMTLVLAALCFPIKEAYENPLNGIGAALQVAEKYGITLHRGTCYSDCRAHLPREHWLYPLRPDTDTWIVCPGIKHDWTPETVTALDTWGNTVQEAVAKMLINARRAGVI